MTGKGNRKQYLRCLICGRQPVPVKRGRLASHLSPGGVKCIAGRLGLEVRHVVTQQRLIAESLKEREDAPYTARDCSPSRSHR